MAGVFGAIWTALELKALINGKSDLTQEGEVAITASGVSEEVAQAFRNRLADSVLAASLSIPVADLTVAYESGIPAKFS